MLLLLLLLSMLDSAVEMVEIDDSDEFKKKSLLFIVAGRYNMLEGEEGVTQSEDAMNRGCQRVCTC